MLAGSVGLAAGADDAVAHPVRAVHVGVLYHDVPLANGDSGGIEDAPNVQAEIQFESPKPFRYILDPSIYLMGSLNTRGDTSFGGFGLNWKFHFAKNWAIEPGVGYVVHTGEIDIPFPPGDPRNVEFSSENILFGSRDQFRLTLGLTRHFGPRWAGQLYYEHLSHGQIIGDGRNQGLDSIGLRAAYRFRDRHGKSIGKE